MWFAISFCSAVVVTMIFLVDPTPTPPGPSVDTVATCVEKYWWGKPVEQWTEVEKMDDTCRTLLRSAMHSNY
jgi:hypothetical protein